MVFEPKRRHIKRTPDWNEVEEMVGSRSAADVHKAADLTRAPTAGNVECSACSRMQIVFLHVQNRRYKTVKIALM